MQYSVESQKKERKKNEERDKDFVCAVEKRIKLCCTSFGRQVVSRRTQCVSIDITHE